VGINALQHAWHCTAGGPTLSDGCVEQPAAADGIAGSLGPANKPCVGVVQAHLRSPVQITGAGKQQQCALVMAHRSTDRWRCHQMCMGRVKPALEQLRLINGSWITGPAGKQRIERPRDQAA